MSRTTGATGGAAKPVLFLAGLSPFTPPGCRVATLGLVGCQASCASTVAALRTSFTVGHVSGYKPMSGRSDVVRVFVDIDLLDGCAGQGGPMSDWTTNPAVDASEPATDRVSEQVGAVQPIQRSANAVPFDTAADTGLDSLADGLNGRCTDACRRAGGAP